MNIMLPGFQRAFVSLVVLFAVVFAAPSANSAPEIGPYPVKIYIFWQEGCPYCAGARSELEGLAARDQRLEVRAIRVGSDALADALFDRSIEHFGYDQAAVPFVVVGDRSFLGYLAGGRSAALYKAAIERCLSAPCPDTIAAISDDPTSLDTTPRAGHNEPKSERPSLLPDVVVLPLFGEIHTRNLSLPALTVLLAAIDGFNPCAMWVLVFLIGLLLGLEDEKRMWILGTAFLGATAVMYFAVMAAWLNLVLFLGAVVWVRLGIGVLAIGGGIYFLREYWTKPEAVCRVTNPRRRQTIMDMFRSVVNRNQLGLAVGGIMALAVMVNFIELLCSAGIPAVYTQILALSDLSRSSYYAYLGLYIAIFMLDDFAIFATAMFAIRVSGLTGSYVRLSHLIGGIVLLVIGAVLMLRPELLSFG